MTSILMPLSDTGIIVGIDPGTKRIGYGVIVPDKKGFRFIDAGLLIPLIPKILDKKTLFSKIHASLQNIAIAHSPILIAIERIYFGHNISSALSVSEIRGALSFMAQQFDILIIDVHPTNVKQVICGYGHADKTAVRKMVFQLITGIPKSLTSRDAIDALAIAMTGYYSFRGNAIIDKARKSGTTDTG